MCGEWNQNVNLRCALSTATWPGAAVGGVDKAERSFSGAPRRLAVGAIWASFPATKGHGDGIKPDGGNPGRLSTIQCESGELSARPLRKQ